MMMFELKVKMFFVEIGMEGVFLYMLMKNGLNLKYKMNKNIEMFIF